VPPGWLTLKVVLLCDVALRQSSCSRYEMVLKGMDHTAEEGSTTRPSTQLQLLFRLLRLREAK